MHIGDQRIPAPLQLLAVSEPLGEAIEKLVKGGLFVASACALCILPEV